MQKDIFIYKMSAVVKRALPLLETLVNANPKLKKAMRSRKHFNPVGVREFYKVLNEINIPKDLVRNERRWSETEKNSLGEKSLPEKEEQTISNWLTL